jgi:hypothetical protein
MRLPRHGDSIKPIISPRTRTIRSLVDLFSAPGFRAVLRGVRFTCAALRREERWCATQHEPARTGCQRGDAVAVVRQRSLVLPQLLRAHAAAVEQLGVVERGELELLPTY